MGLPLPVRARSARTKLSRLGGALRRAGLLVESVFSSGTWYEETSGLSFPDYIAARPSELRNTWHRKRRKLGRGNRLTGTVNLASADCRKAGWAERCPAMRVIMQP
jgi:hypothetical protein